MNFGKWIVVSFILFALFIGVLVTVCMRQEIDLVSKDYYKEELAYQEQIERLNNTEVLSNKPVVQLLENNVLQITLNQSDEIKNGELILFCPSNSKMDRKFKLSALPGESDFIELIGMDRGMYKARLLWTMHDKEFYVEEVINI